MAVKVLHGDSAVLLRSMDDASIDSVVTDPPYALNFMGKQWDTGEVAFSEEFWAEVLRVLKPGGHVAAFGASRGYHRMACAIEDAGFEIRDSLMWVYGTGFPKSHDVAKGINAKLTVGSARTEDMRRIAMGDDYEPSGRGRANYDHGGGSVVNGETQDIALCNAARQWEGWGTALKPAFEPIVLARKPLSEGTVAANVLRWGTGALNIDGCRVGLAKGETPYSYPNGRGGEGWHGRDSLSGNLDVPLSGNDKGRWPANVVHDGSDEVVGAFPTTNGGSFPATRGADKERNAFGEFKGQTGLKPRRLEGGSAARFFYSAKASKADRNGSKHPTVKPIALMEWLATLITPPGGTVLDPFAGSGTTGAAAARKGFNVVLIEREDEYVADIRRRLGLHAPSMEDMLA